MNRSRLLSNVRFRLAVSLVAAGLLAGPALGCSDDPGDNAPAQNQQPDAGPPSDADVDTDGGSEQNDNDGQRPDENSGDDWEWEDEDFEIRNVIPARGPVEGGTDIEIDGAELTDDTDVWFGNQPVETELSDGRLVGTTPPASNRGPVTVRIVSAQGDESKLVNGFTYTEPVDVHAVLPEVLPTDGHLEIDLKGSGFDQQMGVTFSGTPARRVDVVDSGLARVVAPRMPRGHADLEITVPDGGAVLEDAVYFFDPLELEATVPGAGDVAGGQDVTLQGQGLVPEATVRFGDRVAEVQEFDAVDGRLTVTAPPADAPGPVDVTVETDHDIVTLVDGYRYDQADAVDQLYSVHPETAPHGGGTEHVVAGRGLDNPDATFVVDGQSADVVDTGPTHAVVEIPTINTAGPVDVALEIGSTEIDRLDDALEILPELTIDDVTPAAGDADGGEQVTITGSGLEAAQRVTFGGLSAQFESGDQLTVTTPAAEPGTVDVVVDNGRSTARAPDAFSFETDLEVWSMHPARGAMAGNTYVTVEGRGFLGAIDVEVGDQPADDIRRHDVYNLSFRTPPADDIGEQPVTIEATGSQASPPYPFVYFNPLSSFGGAHGPPVDRAINVSVIDFNGNPVSEAFVMLSTDADTPHRGYTDAAGQITLSGPEILGPQTVTATAAEMSTVTVREIDARNLTLVLYPLDPESGDPGEIPPPPMAEFEGTVELTGKTPSPEGGQEYNMSIVETTRNAVGAPTMSPGEGSIVEGGEGDYDIRSRVGDLALVAICGLYDDETETFTPKTMAVERDLAVSDGDRLDVDLECDIPLDSSVPVQITDAVYAPDGPTINRVSSYIDFGYEGVFPMPEPTVGPGDILEVGPLPALEGQLDNVTVSAIAGSYTGDGMPYTRTVLRDVQDLDQLQTTPALVGVPDLRKPGDGGVVGDEIWLDQKGSNDPDFQYLTLSNSLGLPVYTLIAPGDEMVVPMPRFPSFSELSAEQRPEPYPPGSLFALAYAPDIEDFDYNAFTWSDLNPSGWSTFAVDHWTVSLSEE